MDLCRIVGIGHDALLGELRLGLVESRSSAGEIAVKEGQR